MDAVIVIGFMAAALTTSSFLPQVIKAYKTRHTEDISILMYLILVFGIGLWLLYGIMISDLPIIAANGVTLVLVCSVFALKLKYK